MPMPKKKSITPKKHRGDELSPNSHNIQQILNTKVINIKDSSNNMTTPRAKDNTKVINLKDSNNMTTPRAKDKPKKELLLKKDVKDDIYTLLKDKHEYITFLKKLDLSREKV